MRIRDERVLPSVLLGLTAVTGLVDAVSYLALGHVFTANMTGNVVFLGFAAAGTPGLSVTRSGTALAAFLMGAVIGGRAAARTSGGRRERWTGAAFGAEAVLFVTATVVALRFGSGLSNEPTRLYTVIVLTGLAMGIRNATVRKLAVPDLTTTVLTLTLTGLAADSSLAGGSNPGWVRRASAVGAMSAGAAVGAWLLGYSLTLVLALCAFVSAGCATAAFVGVAPDGQAGQDSGTPHAGPKAPAVRHVPPCE
jgi:uncharacterized membrane protein YoaK (UPF0700 family)